MWETGRSLFYVFSHILVAQAVQGDMVIWLMLIRIGSLPGGGGHIGARRSCMRRQRREGGWGVGLEQGSLSERRSERDARQGMFVPKATSPESSFDQENLMTKASQGRTRVWWCMILAYVVAIGLAMAIGPISIGRDGDLAASSFMVAVACAVRRGDDIPSKGKRTCCSRAGSFLRRTVSPSFSKLPLVRAHRWIMEWARTANQPIRPRGAQ